MKMVSNLNRVRPAQHIQITIKEIVLYLDIRFKLLVII